MLNRATKVRGMSNLKWICIIWEFYDYFAKVTVKVRQIFWTSVMLNWSIIIWTNIYEANLYCETTEDNRTDQKTGLLSKYELLIVFHILP